MSNQKNENIGQNYSLNKFKLYLKKVYQCQWIQNHKEIKGKSKYKASNDNNQNLAGGKMFRFWCKQNNGNVLPVRSKLIDEH